MPKTRLVEPTLVDAVRKLSHDESRGFVFVRPDASERFCSFADICREAERRGAHLVARGLEKGSRIALVIPDPDEFVLSFLGAIFAGLVPVPIYPQLTFKNIDGYHDTVAHICQASGASLLLTTASTRGYVEPVVPRVPSLRGIAIVDELLPPAPRPLDVAVAPTDIAFLQFTSGSTSRPKGVVVTHENLAANSEAFMIHGLKKDSSVDKGVSWLPLFHDMGLIGFVIGPLFTDIPCVFLPTASFVRTPRIWLETIHKHRGTITYAPNFAYALVTKRLKEKDVAGLDLSCLRVAGSGAEPIQAKTLREFAAKLAPAGFVQTSFLPSYGMAEATLAITFVEKGDGLTTDIVAGASVRERAPRKVAPEDPGAQEIVNCGKPFPDHEVAVVADDDTRLGTRLGDRQVGQIITRGPSISPGYFNEPELTAAAFRDGWLYTGDLGYTVDGNVFICGRLKDVIIIRGRNFYPSDIEWAVSELPGIRRGNVAAFGVNVDGEEQLVVCAEAFQSDAQRVRLPAADGGEGVEMPLADAISSTVSAQFGVTAHKIAIVPQGSLPRTSSGKPQRRKTKQMFEDGLLTRPKGVLDGPAPREPGSGLSEEVQA